MSVILLRAISRIQRAVPVNTQARGEAFGSICTFLERNLEPCHTLLLVVSFRVSLDLCCLVSSLELRELLENMKICHIRPSSCL